MEIETTLLKVPLRESPSAPQSYSDVGFLSSLFFTWVLPAYRKSLQHTLQAEDFVQVEGKDSVEGNQLKYSGTVLATIWRKYKWQVLGGMALSMTAGAFEFTLPLYTLYLESFFSSSDSPDISYLSVLILLFLLCLKLVFWRAIIWLEKRLHLRLRVALITLMYADVLNATTNVATAEVVNELELDGKRIADGCLNIFIFSSSSLEFLISLFLLITTMGSAAFFGLFFLLATMLSNLAAGSSANRKYDQIMQFKDKRMKYSMELFGNIRAVKIAVWEDALLQRVKEVRTAESAILRKFLLLWSGMTLSLWSTPLLAATITFAAKKWVSEQSIGVESAFATIAVFFILQSPLVWMPGAITAMWTALASCRRIDVIPMQKFMQNEKVCDRRIRNTEEKGTVKFTDASFAYTEGGEAVLRNISLQVRPGEFVAVVGSVGAGKSSLANALLGEMQWKAGSLAVSGTVAYTAALESWIQNATLKLNILFGKPLDHKKYQSTLEACALLSDLALLPGGDNTEIGEKGINLSGGQKARVALARSVYQDCDIYVLDDPLSSVDAHVASHIFHQCFLGVLKGKTRILITHNTNFLHLVDRVVVMESGTIKEITGSREVPRDAQSLIGTEAQESHYTPIQSEQCNLVSDEDRKVGKVDFSVYLTFLQYCGGPKPFVICGALLVLGLISRFLSDLSIKHWTEHPEDSGFYWYLCFCGLACCSLLFRSVLLLLAGIRGGTAIHSAMVHRLIRAPINLFYDVTPIGRILTRLSRDQTDAEMEIAYNLGEVMTAVGTAVAAVSACVFFLPWMAVITPVLVACCFHFQQVYLQLSRETTRLERISRSPMVQQFTESVAGLKTIRCFGKQAQFTSSLNRLVEVFARVTFTNGGVDTWLMLCMEMVTIALVGATVWYLVATVDKQTQAVVAIVLTYMIPLADGISDSVFKFSTLERFMIAVERTHALTQYCSHRIPQEEPAVAKGDKDLRHWPTEGRIQLEGVTVKYRPNTPVVVSGVSACIQGKERVGIAGRTGSGKSTLSLALFRILELHRGVIWLDGVDIGTVGLHTLRRALTMVPQDPVLFQGSIRYNLDPCSLHPDDRIAAAVADVGLQFALDKDVEEGGKNLSVGERQLMCIARAALANPSVLVLDEATSAVDHATDSLIQRYVRGKFQCTVLTIAHRLQTILDSDRVMVMEGGRLIEFDTPGTLMRDKTSAFFRLAQSLGLGRDANST